MAASLPRIIRKFFRRSLEAGGGGWRWDGAGQLATANSAILAGAGIANQRALYQSVNNPHVVSAVRSLVASIVGDGVFPRSRHPEEATRRALDEGFSAWSGEADAVGRLDWAGLAVQIVRSVIVHGESFAIMDTTADGAMVLQVLHPDQVDRALHRELADGHRIRAGVELDARGRPVAYHVLPAAPGDVLPAAAWQYSYVRVPAEDMIHVFEPIEPGQVRGLSWLAPVLSKVRDYDAFEDAQLIRQKVAALFCGFLTTPDGDVVGFDGNQLGSILASGMEPGTIKVMPGGTRMEFSQPAEVGEVSEFLRSQLRAIAAGIGVTYEQMTGDLAGANYSSARVGLIEFRRRVEQFRWCVLVPQLCRPVWRRFVALQALQGTIPTADEAAFAADWNFPAWDWVDPKKDIEAEILAVDAGFKSRSQVIAAMGEDPERVDSLRAEDKARGARLGFTPPNAVPRSGGGGTPNAAPVEPEDGADE